MNLKKINPKTMNWEPNAKKLASKNQFERGKIFIGLSSLLMMIFIFVSLN